MKLVPLSENNSSGVPRPAETRKCCKKFLGSEFCKQFNVNSQGLIQDFLLGGGKSNSDLIVVFFFVLAILVR